MPRPLPIKRFERYAEWVNRSRFLVFIPYDISEPIGGECGQPIPRASPKHEHYQAIPVYPVDGEFTVYGFRNWKPAAEFALANGTEVYEKP